MQLMRTIHCLHSIFKVLAIGVAGREALMATERPNYAVYNFVEF